MENSTNSTDRQINLWHSIDSIKSNYEQAKREFQQKGRESLDLVYKGLFNKYPYLKSLTWTEYTPYFADGDPCEFSVNDLYFTIGPNELGIPDLGIHPKWDEESENSYYEKQYLDDLKTGPVITRERIVKHWRTGEDVVNTYTEKSYPSDEVKAFAEDIEKLGKILHSMEEILQNIYGDHVKVTVTSEGTNIEDYDHD